jgi:hypothetical protein
MSASLPARNEGLFTPPGMRSTVEMPGNNGGAIGRNYQPAKSIKTNNLQQDKA